MAFPALLLEWINQLPKEKRGRFTVSLTADPIIWRAVCQKPELALYSLQQTQIRFPADFAVYFVKGEVDNLNPIAAEFESQSTDQKDLLYQSLVQALSDSTKFQFGDINAALCEAISIYENIHNKKIRSDITRLDISESKSNLNTIFSILARLNENGSAFTKYILENNEIQKAASYIANAIKTDPRSDGERLDYFKQIEIDDLSIFQLREICQALKKTNDLGLRQLLARQVLEQKVNFEKEIRDLQEEKDPIQLSKIASLLVQAEYFAELTGNLLSSRTFHDYSRLALDKQNSIFHTKKSDIEKNEPLIKFRIPGRIEDFQYQSYILDENVKKSIGIADADPDTAHDLINQAFCKLFENPDFYNIEKHLGYVELGLFWGFFEEVERIFTGLTENNPSNLEIKKIYAHICAKYGDVETAIDQFTIVDAQNSLNNELTSEFTYLLFFNQNWSLLSYLLDQKSKSGSRMTDGEQFLLEYSHLLLSTQKSDHSLLSVKKGNEHKKIAETIFSALNQPDKCENNTLLIDLCKNISVPIEICLVICWKLLESKFFELADACVSSRISLDTNNHLYFIKSYISLQMKDWVNVNSQIKQGCQKEALIDKIFVDLIHTADDDPINGTFKTLIDDLIKVFPLNPEIRGLIAREELINYESRGHAIKILKNLIGRIKVDPNWCVWYAIGMLNCSLGDFPIGARNLEKQVKEQLLNLLDDNLSYPLEIVQELVRIELGEEKEKENKYLALLSNNAFQETEDFWRVQLGLAQVYVNNQEYDKAYPLLKNALKLKPHVTELENIFFNVLQTLKLHDEAFSVTCNILQREFIDGNELTAYLHFVKRVKRVEGKEKAGFQYLQDFAGIHPNLEAIKPALSLLAAISDQKEEFEQLIQESELNLELNALALLTCAQAAVDLQDTSRALRFAERAMIRVEDLNFLQQIELAAVFFTLNQPEKMDAIFRNSVAGRIAHDLLVDTDALTETIFISNNINMIETLPASEISDADLPLYWKTRLINPKISHEVNQIKKGLHDYNQILVRDSLMRLSESSPKNPVYPFLLFIFNKMFLENIDERGYAELKNKIIDINLSEEYKNLLLGLLIHHELDLGHDIQAAEMLNSFEILENKCFLLQLAFSRLSKRSQHSEQINILEWTDFENESLECSILRQNQADSDLLHYFIHYFAPQKLYLIIARLELENGSLDMDELLQYLTDHYSLFAAQKIMPVITRSLEINENLIALLVTKNLLIDNQARIEEIINKTKTLNTKLITEKDIKKLSIDRVLAILQPNQENLISVIDEVPTEENTVSKVRAFCRLGMVDEAQKLLIGNNYELLLTYALNLPDSQLSEKKALAAKLIQVDQNNPLGYVLLARMYEIDGFINQSLESMEVALSIWADEPRWLAWASRLAFSIGNVQKTLEYGNQAMETGEFRADDWLWIYENPNSNNGIEELADFIDQLKIGAKDDFGLKVKSAEKLIQKGEYRKALSEIVAARGLQPGRHESWLLQADIALRIGNFEKANQLMTKILKQEPSHEAAILLKTELIYQEKGVDAAITFIEKSKEALKNNSALIIKRSSLLERAGRIDLAVETLKQGLKNNPKDLPVLIALSKILCTLENYDEAEKYAQSAYRITTRNVELLLILGKINQSQGDLDQAIRFTTEAIKANPLSVDANIALGMIYIERHQKDFAETVIRKALKLMPNEFRLYDFLATLFTSEGNYKEAIKILEIAFEHKKPTQEQLERVELLKNSG